MVLRGWIFLLVQVLLLLIVAPGTGSIPGTSYTLPNGTTVTDESGGFVVLEFPIPQSMLGSNNTSKIRYVVQTDGSVTYGGSQDAKEGLTVDWFKVVNSAGVVLDSNLLSTTSAASHYSISSGNNDWSFLQIGTGGLSITDSLENAQALPPGGWSISNQPAKQVGNSVQFVQTTRMDQVHSPVQI